MSWDFDSDANGAKTAFTKFPVGITRVRVLDSSPNVRWTHWMDLHKRSVNCPGNGCPICNIRKEQKANKETYTYGMSRRFAMNVYNYETEEVEIMEQGITFFQDLRDVMEDLKEDNKQLIDAVLKVRRRGTGKDDTSYRIDIDEIVEMSAKEKELTENVIDLKEYFKANTPEQITRVLSGEDWNDVMSEGSKEEDSEDIEIK